MPLLFLRLRGGAVSPDSIQRSLASKLVLDLEHPEPYTLDGELYPATDHFELEAGPELEFVVPALQHRTEDSKLRYSQAGPWAMRFLL